MKFQNLINVYILLLNILKISPLTLEEFVIPIEIIHLTPQVLKENLMPSLKDK
jgi:hypothetical protein